MAQTEKEHKERHILLHQNLDELVGDMIIHTKMLPSKTSVLALMRWSNSQVQNPIK
jgi:hypothetical protein